MVLPHFKLRCMRKISIYYPIYLLESHCKNRSNILEHVSSKQHYNAVHVKINKYNICDIIMMYDVMTRSIVTS